MDKITPIKKEVETLSDNNVNTSITPETEGNHVDVSMCSISLVLSCFNCNTKNTD